jgi:glycosyltransferase involved in cell wall biosynthesis
VNWPLISVIIPTYGREEPLRDTLEDVLKQDYPAFEVLVVDQSPTHQPETQAYLEQLANRVKSTLNWTNQALKANKKFERWKVAS